MVDAVLIQQCADPGLKRAIVEQFMEHADSQDLLAISVRSETAWCSALKLDRP